MTNNITKKLILYFTSVLLIFSIIVGIVFYFSFTNQTMNIYKSNLEKRANLIADNVQNYMYNNPKNLSSNKGYGGNLGYGAYIKIINEISMGDVWIVDQNAQTIEMATKNFEITYSELPTNAKELVSHAFKGKTSFSDTLSELLNVPTLTVSVPVYDNNNNEVIAAVLLNSPLEELNSTKFSGILILFISLLLALILGIFPAIQLSRKFTKPLKEMESCTKELAKGNYTCKTNIVQKDEIGYLAQNIDILSEKLMIAKEESDNLEKMRKDYISNISHELRTPVTVIRGSLEALNDGIITDPDRKKTYYQEMLNESIHLERMVNDLLELSRLQNINYSIDMYPLNLIDVLNDAIRSIKHIALTKNITINYSSKINQKNIDGDYGRLRQMFLVILDNAIKFSPENLSIDINVDTDKITITDYGTGIHKKDLNHIFERFYKTSDERNKNGTGLGLAISKEIAERHNLNLSVKSSFGNYTSFIIQ